MPARRTRSISRQSRRLNRNSPPAKKKSKESKVKFVVIVCFLLVLASIFLYLKSSRKLWNGIDKVSLVVHEESSDVKIIVFDPQTKDITNINIPKNTEVEVARNLGEWKLGSVWDLGKNERLDGVLLKETVIRHFKFPVYAWADSPAIGLGSNNIKLLIGALITPYKDDLTFADKLSIVWFSLGVDNAKRKDIQLSDTNFLSEATLADGTEGYKLSGLPNPKINAIFADNQISEVGRSLVIYDRSGVGRVAEDAGSVLQVFGAKVASIVDQEVEESDCVVGGKNIQDAKKVAKIFACGVNQQTIEGNFDLQLTLGKGFAARF